MEFKRYSVVCLYLAIKPQVTIVRARQCINVNKSDGDGVGRRNS